MAPRVNKIRHDDETRAKIQASQLVNRLTEHALGSAEMTATQVTAALGLLKKTLPDLSSIDHSGEMDVTHNTISSEPLTEEQWGQRYGAPH